MLRNKPYTTTQTNWGSILTMILTIPMNQREYSWTIKELSQFINDIKYLFEDTNYIEKLGSIINYKGNNKNEIYDGQQRTITTILILICIANLTKKNKPALHNNILSLLSINPEIDNLNDSQTKLKEKFNTIENIILPKMYCVNPYDMEALIHIFNNTVFSYLFFVKNLNDFIKNDNDINNNEADDADNAEDNDINYICNYEDCEETITSKSHFIRHLKTVHKINCTYSKKSKIYDAYIYIYEELLKLNYVDEKLKNLYKYIINDIDIQLYDCSDPIYVSKIFDWENNRGREVVKLDLVKNPILTNINDERKFEIYTKWEELKKTEIKTVKDFGEKIFDIAIQLYNNCIERKVNYEDLYKIIIDKKNTINNVEKFFKIIQNLIDIYKKIENHKFGRLITNSPRICLPWEAYMYCMLPIFYKRKSIDDKLITLFTKWYFRNIGTNLRTFNNLAYSTKFIEITKKVLIDKEKKYNYYDEIEQCLKDNMDISINKDNYCTLIENNILFKSTNGTYTLLFLETCLATDIQTVSLEYTVEHIFPQRDKLKLKDGKNIDRIGNLTLLEGRNSENGHRGNSSCGAREYNKKIQSYKGSSSKITNDIPTEYPDKFDEEEIIKRTKTLIKKLNKYTMY